MNLSKKYVELYNEYLKIIHETKRQIKHINRVTKFTLKRKKIATKEEVEKLENIGVSGVEEIAENQKIIESKVYNFSNGDVYIGKMLDGKMDGEGSYVFGEGDYKGMEYIGNFENDMKDGKGTCIFANGNIYTGDFKEDLMDGIGQMIYKSQDEYIGNWLKGQKNGLGIYKWNEGSIYIGEFKNSKMEGNGTCYDKDGNLMYEGQWKNNLIHGKGTYIWEEGKRYTGEFMYGKKHGKGIFYLNEELVYDGTWKFDKPSIFNKSLDEIFSLKL